MKNLAKQYSSVNFKSAPVEQNYEPNERYVKPSTKPATKPTNVSHISHGEYAPVLSRKLYCPHCNILTSSSTVTASLLSGQYTSYLANCCGKQVSVRNNNVN